MQPRVENAFWHLKRWGGMATGNCKNSDSFFAAIHTTVYVLMGYTRNYIV